MMWLFYTFVMNLKILTFFDFAFSFLKLFFRVRKNLHFRIIHGSSSRSRIVFTISNSLLGHHLTLDSGFSTRILYPFNFVTQIFRNPRPFASTVNKVSTWSITDSGWRFQGPDDNDTKIQRIKNAQQY